MDNLTVEPITGDTAEPKAVQDDPLDALGFRKIRGKRKCDPELKIRQKHWYGSDRDENTWLMYVKGVLGGIPVDKSGNPCSREQMTSEYIRLACAQYREEERKERRRLEAGKA